jgi:hypothetical protein
METHCRFAVFDGKKTKYSENTQGERKTIS